MDSCTFDDNSEVMDTIAAPPNNLDNATSGTAKVIFGIDTLHDAQLKACCSLLLGCQVALIDKTEFGKSLGMYIVALFSGGGQVFA
jgi:hypothetical protein